MNPTYLGTHLAEVEASHTRHTRRLAVEEGCYSRRVLLVGMDGHNPGEREHHILAKDRVVVSWTKEDILGYMLEEGRVEENVIEGGSRNHHRAVERRSRPGQDNRTSRG